MIRSTYGALCLVTLALVAGCGGAATAAPEEEAPMVGFDAAVAPDAVVSPDGAFAAPTCARGSWCWESPHPQGDILYTVLLEGPADGWAAGGHGALLHLGQGGWTLQPRPTEEDIWKLWGPGTGEVWAIANAPTDGEGYGPTPGGVLHWDGSTWATVTPGPGVYVALAGSAPNDVWTVATAQDDSTTVWRWNGAKWSEMPAAPDGYAFDTLCVRGPSDAWATAVASEISGLSASVLHWDGSSWTAVYALASDADYVSSGQVACAKGSDVWVLYGEFQAPASIFRWDGSAWDAMPVPPAAGDGWLRVAASGDTIVMDGVEVDTWTGSAWQATPLPVALPAPGFSIQSLGDVDVAPGHTAEWLATGSDLIARSGGAWDTSGLASPLWLGSVFGAQGGPAVYATGAASAQGPLILGRRDAAALSWSFAPASPSVSAAGGPSWGASQDDIWVAGPSGAIVHVAGGTLTSTVLGSAPIVGISGTSANNVWALDDGGGVYRWNGAAWSSTIPPMRASFDGGPSDVTGVDIAVVGPDEAWGVGNWNTAEQGPQGAVFHWDGRSWSGEWLGSIDLPGTYAVAIAATSATDVWVVGSSLWHLASSGSWTVVQSGTGDVTPLRVGHGGLYWLSENDTGSLIPTFTVNRWDPTTASFSSWPVPLSPWVAVDSLWVGANPADGRDTVWVSGQNSTVLSIEP